MFILTGIALCIFCTGVLSEAVYGKDAEDNLLFEIIHRSSPDNDDVDTDQLTRERGITDVREFLDSIDASGIMDMDDLEKLRVAIHHKDYCHCHYNHCECCRTVYLFWKIPIFKACVGVWYEGTDFVLRLKVYGITLVKHKLPLRNQKPICARVLGTYDLCAELYDVKIKNGVVHACLKIIKPVTMDLKCFTLHRHGRHENEKSLSLDQEVDSTLTLAEDDYTETQM